MNRLISQMKYLLDVSLGQYPKLSQTELLTLLILVTFSCWFLGHALRRPPYGACHRVNPLTGKQAPFWG